MHNRAKAYLPAVPYLIGVGLQVSGRTHFWLAYLAFEIAIIISAAVVWSYWADWRQTALVGGHPNRAIQSLLVWSGLKIRQFSIRPEILAALIVFILMNGLTGAFFSLTEQQQPGTAVESSQRAKLMAFYDQISTLAYQQLPKPMTDADYDKWDETATEEIDSMQEWVRANMGQGAMFRLVDLHNLKMANFTHAVNQKHNTKIIMLLAMQANLREMIETTTWDKK